MNVIAIKKNLTQPRKNVCLSTIPTSIAALEMCVTLWQKMSKYIYPKSRIRQA